MRNLLVSPCLLLCMVVGGASTAAAGPSGTEAIARKLFEGELKPEEAARAWAKAKLKVKQATKLVRGLLPLKRKKPRDHEIELTDANGRTTDARLSFPKRPGKDGRYRAVILLHGLGGDSEQAFALGRALAPPNAILIAPSAKKLPSNAPKRVLCEVGRRRVV